MDLAGSIGLIGAIGMIIGAMIYGGGLAPFVDIPSILIVFGGTAFAVLATTSMGAFTGSFKAMARMFKPSNLRTDDLVKRMIEL